MLNVHVAREYGKSTLEHTVQKTSRNRIILNSFLVCILKKNKYHQTLKDVLFQWQKAMWKMILG